MKCDARTLCRLPVRRKERLQLTDGRIKKSVDFLPVYLLVDKIPMQTEIHAVEPRTPKPCEPFPRIAVVNRVLRLHADSQHPLPPVLPAGRNGTTAYTRR